MSASDPFELSDEAPPPSPDEAPGETPFAYLDTLNETQRQAVEATEGPVLVLAGAGTGKTRVLITRLAHILKLGLATPYQVLAVTFTNKAAREMSDRVSVLLGQPVAGWWVGTFHAVGARILRSHAEAVGLRSNFTILDEDDQVRLVKQVLADHDIDDKRWPARAVLAVIQGWKDRGLAPGGITGQEGSEAVDGRAAALYEDYQDRLRILNAADFGDLLLHCLEVFKNNPDVLGGYQDRFRYILVDEYQDSNVAQYLWLRLLAQRGKNICCVGDDDQSIYSWRGAEVGNILRFENDFPGARVVRLERNYRSTSNILAAASGLIANNSGRLGKTLWTDLGDGEKVAVRGLWDGREEARATAETMAVLHSKGQSLDAMAVLVRTGSQTREFEERLIADGVPYRVIGGPRFYERKEIRDAVAYLRVIAQAGDDLAFSRIVNLPKRGLGPATTDKVQRLAGEKRIPLTAAARRLAGGSELKAKAKATLAALLDDFERWRGLLGSLSHVKVAETMLDESGYRALWLDAKTPDAPGRLDNLKELTVALEEFVDLQEFLEHVSLVMEIEGGEGGEKVSLMTLHGAKGLEFETVFLPGWEEGLFPHQRALAEAGEGGLEEERRLAYVGLTRARSLAIVSFAASRRIHGRWVSAYPSRFIGELPAENIERSADQGLFGGGHGGRPEVPAFPPGRRRDTDKIAEELLAPGRRVFHEKFGYGRILARDGDKLEIAFDKAGDKKVMASFVKPDANGP